MRRTLGLAAMALCLSSPVVAGPELVVDMASGKVLIANDALQSWHPASLTKLMTTYVALKAIEEGRLSAGSPVTVSAAAAKAPPSRSGLKPGSRLALMDALRVLMVKSANDLAIAVAETVSGSVPAFVDEMNAESARLGMRSSRWRNPHGLNDPAQVTTAKDMATLATALRRDFPADWDLFHIHGVSLGGRVMLNHNHAVGRYPFADGMKTGFICASGFNVVTTATKDGRQLVAVVLGEDAAIRRDAKASLLLAAGFQIPSERSGVSLATLSGPHKPAPARSCGRRASDEDSDAGIPTASMEAWVRSFAAIRRELSQPIAIRLLPAQQPLAVAEGKRVVPEAPVKTTLAIPVPVQTQSGRIEDAAQTPPPRRF